jgi:hypothetical protein
MKQINLYFDFEFTSLSPDAQPISLGIVSEEVISNTVSIKTIPIEKLPFHTQEKIKELEINELTVIGYDDINGEKVVALSGGIAPLFFVPPSWVIKSSNSFYAEFSDFDINRCDDWVKENVVSKLKYYGTPEQNKMFLDSSIDEGTIFGSQNTNEIKGALHKWLKQFSDYQIQFVCDCGTYDWYWMLQLLDERESNKGVLIIDRETINDEDIDRLIKEFKRQPTVISRQSDSKLESYFTYKTGLPKLHSNISPVPQDLNDLIALKKDISVREAFGLNREELAFGRPELSEHEKHNALWDAKVIKATYEKLK